MNKIIEQIKKFLSNITKKIVIWGGIILLMLIVFKCQNNKIQSLSQKLNDQTSLTSALTDTLKVYQVKNGILRYEKKTIQADLNILNDKNITLTNEQRELLKQVKQLNKENIIIAAANIRLKIKIDSLLNLTGIVDTTNKTILFPYQSKNLIFNAIAKNVQPYDKNKKSYLDINNLELPNDQKINFYWKDNKKEGYPISFSVENSNEYFKVVNIESYVIPEIKKEDIKPTFWQKTGEFFKKGGNTGLYIGIGLGAGYFLFK